MSLNTARKGREVEALAVQWLQNQGYMTHRTIRSAHQRHGRWYSAGNDIFGCIDILAKRAGDRMRFIQVTCDGSIGMKKKDLARVPWTSMLESVEIWRWDARTKCFQLYLLDDEFELDSSNRIFPHG